MVARKLNNFTFYMWKVYVCAQSLSWVQLCDLMSNSVACQAPLSMGFSRNGLLYPSSGDLPNPGIKPRSPALVGRFLTTEPPGKPLAQISLVQSSSGVSFKSLTTHFKPFTFAQETV